MPLLEMFVPDQMEMILVFALSPQSKSFSRRYFRPEMPEVSSAAGLRRWRKPGLVMAWSVSPECSLYKVHVSQ